MLTLRGASHSADAFTHAAAQRGIPVTALQLDADELRHTYGADCALIRPDQVVAWRGNAVADAGSVLDQVTARLNWKSRP